MIVQPPGRVITLNFTDFDLEGSSRCFYDYLEVRDGPDENSTLIGKFCGDPTLTPDPITSSFNHVWIKFVTDGSIQNRGFRLR